MAQFPLTAKSYLPSWGQGERFTIRIPIKLVMVLTLSNAEVTLFRVNIVVNNLNPVMLVLSGKLSRNTLR